MPEIIVPHRVVYQVEGPVALRDVVAALLATEQLWRETAPLLESCIPGLTIERVGVSVSQLSQQSPFVQALIVAIYALHQKDLDKAMPKIVEQIFGTPVPEAYGALMSLAFVLLLLYGAEGIRNQVSKSAYSKRIKERLDSVATELSGECGISEERIKKILEKQYGKSRLRVLTRAAIDFFRPSKQQHNAPVLIGKTEIDSDAIAEIPNEAEIEAADVPEISRMIRDVSIELHAQDMDRAKQGWAGIAPEVSPKRLRLELEPPIKPEQIYMKSKVRGDVMVILRKRSDGSYHPAALHLLDITQAE